MIETTILLCALSVPPVFIDGPLHKPSYVDAFDMLVDYAWRRADIRIGERERRTAILVGQDAEIEEAMRKDGWYILHPPYYPFSTSMVIHLPSLGGNLEGIDRAVSDLAEYLIPGGFFIVAPFTFEDFMPSGVDDVERLIMRAFNKTQFTAQMNHRVYGIWSKKSRWMREAA